MTPPLARWACALSIAATAILSACSEDNLVTPPTHTLSGHVRFVSAQRNVDGDSTDVQRVEDADSVRVYLYQGTSLEDSTRTVAGGYTFSGLGDGSYSTAVALWGGIGDTVSIANLASDAVLDTLELNSAANMITYPNPFLGSIYIRFPVQTAPTAEMLVRRPSGLRVRTLLQGPLADGYHEVQWDGEDDQAQPLPPGPYWILLRVGSEYRARVVVKSSS